MNQSKTKSKEPKTTSNANQSSAFHYRGKDLYAAASFGVGSKGYPTNFSSIYHQKRG